MTEKGRGTMRTFNAVVADPNRSVEMEAVQNRILKFVCGVMPRLNVVGNRISIATGQPVTQAEANAKAQSAQVCPFVQESINRDEYWIEEVVLTNSDRPLIEDLLRERADEFMAQAPAYDPRITGKPAGSRYIYKTYMTVFPNVVHPKGQLQLFEDIHKSVKADLTDMGLMLGQFYHGCPQPAIYNPTWTGVVLSLPYPAFAIRYMVAHDKKFNGQPPARTAIAFQRYFPGV